MSMSLSARSHEARTDCRHTNPLVAKFGMKAFRESGEGELGRDVGKEMWNGYLAANGRDVDDGSAALGKEEWKCGVRGVDGPKEIRSHSLFINLDGLILSGTDLDDSGIVDEDV